LLNSPFGLFLHIDESKIFGILWRVYLRLVPPRRRRAFRLHETQFIIVAIMKTLGQKFIKPLAYLILFIMVLFQMGALSQIPRTVLYQGTLTDNNGLPVPDDTYFIRFRIWSDSSSADISHEKWNSNIQTFDVLGGLLEAKLGAPPMPALPNDIFDKDTNLYLGMSIDTAPELRPRIKFSAVPYAYKALLSDTAAIALVTAQNSVTGSSIVDGSIGLMELSQSGALSGEVIKWDGSQWVTSPVSGANGDITAVGVGSGLAGGGDSGAVAIYVPPDGIQSLHLAPNSVGNSELATNSVGSLEIAPGAVGTSDLAVSSIGSSEIIDNSILGADIIDEPGLAQNRNADTFDLDNLMMIDLAIVTLTTPASGFIFLTGRVNFRMYGATSNNLAYLQIDQAINGTEIPGSYSVCGFAGYPATGDYFFTGTCQRTFFMSAGTHTFRLEARQIASSLQSFIAASSPILTAMYFQRSYGGVVISSEQPPPPVPDK